METHFAYEDGDSDYGYMDAIHLDIIIFFAKANGSIDHFIDYESVKKNLIDIYVYMKNECLHQYQRICVLLIVQQLVQFSRVIKAW